MSAATSARGPSCSEVWSLTPRRASGPARRRGRCPRGLGRSHRQGVRRLPRRQPDRSWRHGRRLRRHRPLARPARRAEGPRRGAGERPAFRRRFVSESKLAASLDHPNVIPIHAAGEHDGILYIAMRLVPGDDLRTLVRRRRATRARPGGAVHRAGRGRARRRPRARPRPSRRQARQRPRHAGGPRVPHRLRAQQAGRRRQPGHAHRHGARHARLHRAGADPRRDDRARTRTSTRSAA